MMNETLQIKNRGIQILKLLKQHGPLSFRGLKAMMEPEIKDRRLHSSLARLAKNGLLQKRLERVFRGAGVFYQLAQDIKARERIASVLGYTAKDLLQPEFRSRELIHAEACALWANQLQKLFPNATLVRDFELHNNKDAHEILLTDRNDYELMPDLLMTLNGGNGKAKISVAFEIERSRKSSARLLAKLRKYANETALDGLVYICESAQVSEPVRRIFLSGVAPKSLRISHYGDYFFLFSNELMTVSNEKTRMFNANSADVLLVEWLTQLRTLPIAARRSKIFEVGAGSCSHSEETIKQ